MSKQGDNNRIFGVNLCDVMSRPTQKIVPTVIKEMFLNLQKNGIKNIAFVAFLGYLRI